MATDGLTEAADALYGLVPEEFTAARNARAPTPSASTRRSRGGSGRCAARRRRRGS